MHKRRPERVLTAPCRHSAGGFRRSTDATCVHRAIVTSGATYSAPLQPGK